MELKYLKLRSGDELFGEVPDKRDIEVSLRGDGDALIRLQRPWRLLLSNKGYVPMPMPLDDLVVADSDVLLSGSVDADLTAAYREQVGGLVTPPGGLLVPTVS